MIHPIMAQALAPWAPLAKPRFEKTYCSQCGRDTGPGDAGHSSCATHGPQEPKDTAPDLTGLYCFEFVTSTDIAVRCYLEYEAAERETRWEPGNIASMDLLYAFVGLVDIAGSELMPDSLQKQIEADALVAKLEEDEQAKDDAAIARWEERQAA